ncbi:MAG: (Fe-S)-binding protein [Anaerolineales bacterium]|nr:(Fe-S)-binding protein [Anaerolineales bacterium]
MNDKSSNRLKQFGDECIQCSACLQTCPWLDDLGLTPGEIAGQVLNGYVNEEVVQAIQRCSLCGLCSQTCPVNLDPSELMQTSREALVQRGKIQLDDYDLMQVDRDWNFFSLYRSTFGIQFDDLYADKYDTLFFPGCTLASYAPELTRTIHTWLQQQGMQVGFSEMCCGKPLASIGLEDRAVQLLDGLREQLNAAGATKLVTACPNCLHLLQEHLKDFELLSLYDLLREAGVQVQGEERLTIHDSCPDRYDLAAGKQVRALLSGHPLLEMEHHGRETICCGSGGIVSMIDPALSEQRAHERMAEFSATGADRCVTACMSCAHRLARVAPEGTVVHCLELVFATHVDYAQMAANVQAMWEGEWGAYNLYRLSQAKLVTKEKGTEE